MSVAVARAPKARGKFLTCLLCFSVSYAPQAKFFKQNVHARSKIKTISRFQEKSLILQDKDPNFKTISGNSGISGQWEP